MERLLFEMNGIASYFVQNAAAASAAASPDRAQSSAGEEGTFSNLLAQVSSVENSLVNAPISSSINSLTSNFFALGGSTNSAAPLIDPTLSEGASSGAIATEGAATVATAQSIPGHFALLQSVEIASDTLQQTAASAVAALQTAQVPTQKDATTTRPGGSDDATRHAAQLSPQIVAPPLVVPPNVDTKPAPVQKTASTAAAPAKAPADKNSANITGVPASPEAFAHADPNDRSQAQANPVAALFQVDNQSSQRPSPQSDVGTAQTNLTPATSSSFHSSLVEAQKFAAPAVLTPNQPVPLDALAVHIARKHEAGSSQFEIRLHPADLGKLDISITVAEDGRVQAVLRAERADTLDILQRDARVLENQLRQAGLDVNSNSLSFHLSNGHDQRHAPHSGLSHFDAPLGSDENGEDGSATQMIALRPADGIDISV